MIVTISDSGCVSVMRMMLEGIVSQRRRLGGGGDRRIWEARSQLKQALVLPFEPLGVENRFGLHVHQDHDRDAP